MEHEGKLYCMTQGKVNGKMTARQRHVRELEAMERRLIWCSLWAGACGIAIGLIIASMIL